MKDEDIIKDAKEFYAEADGYESRWREQWNDDLRFRALDQWPESVRKARELAGPGEPPRPCLVFDQTDQYVRQVINDARLNPPALKATPVDDKADVEVAENLQGIFRYIEAVSRATNAYNTALDWAVTIGRGFIRLHSAQIDEYRNLWEPRISRVANAMQVWYDPHSIEIDGSDASDAIIVIEMSRGAFKRKYGEDAPTNTWVGEYDSWINKDTVLIAEWHTCREESVDMVITADGRMTPELAAKRGLMDFRTEKVKQKVAMVHQLTGAEVIESTKFVGGGVGIVPVYGNERYTAEGRELFGLIRAAKDPQRMLNYLASNFAEASNGQTRAPWVLPFEAASGFEQQWERANQSAVPYLPYNHTDADGQPLPAPSRQNVDLNLMGYGNAMMLQQSMLQSAIGMYQAAIGAAGQEKSGVAIRERANQSDVSTYHYIANLGASIQQIGRMIMKMIPEQYDTARVQKILGEDGESSQVMIDPASPVPFGKGEHNGSKIDVLNPLIGEYDIQITIGPSFSSRREEAAVAIGEQMGKNPMLQQLAGDIYYNNLDWPGAKEIAKRLKLALPPEIKAAEENDEVPPEILNVVGQIQQAVQGREQQFAQGLQSAQQAKAEIDKALSDLRIAQANDRAQKVEIQAAMQDLEHQKEMIEQRIKSATDEIHAAQKDAEAQIMSMQSQQPQEVQEPQESKAVMMLADVTAQNSQMLAMISKQLSEPKQVAVSINRD